MNWFNRLCAASLLSAGLCLVAPATGAFAAEVTANPPTVIAPVDNMDTRPQVQIAILLDTSSSMDGLINQAKSHLWKVVNEFATAKQNGKAPVVKVALYEYGNDGLPAESGHIRQVLPLTTDLDIVSEKLFGLHTNGGSEYCGQVIEKATAGLDWSANNKDFKAIFICGNEEFTQGGTDYKKSCADAIAKGVIVNTIFCGPETHGVNTMWADGAKRADGQFLFIDQNETAVHVAAPQDDEIVKLSAALNGTYIAYGHAAPAAAARQEAQDNNAVQAQAGAALDRALAKSSANYCNEGWDMVDAMKQKDFKLESVKEEDLPEVMRKMTLEERQAYVAGKTKERAAIQAQIQTLNEAREKFIAAEMKKRGLEDKSTLGSAMVTAVRTQCEKKEFQFGK